MIEYMSDSRRTELDPRILTLDPAMQARDVELIQNHKKRESQAGKQASQDAEILDDLRKGLPIHQAITVFVVDDDHIVVDGFHRTGACLAYLEEKPEADLMIPAMVIENRTYQEALSAAQEANRAHGVGVTKEEITQANFRQLIVTKQFELSVSKVAERLGIQRGQANHYTRGLKACREALGDMADVELISNDAYEAFVEQLKQGLESKHDLPSSFWDSKGFPKMRRLSDVVSGKSNLLSDLSESEYAERQINDASETISRLVQRYGDDYFREGLRKAVRGAELGISVTKRDKWLENTAAVEGDKAPDDWDSSKPIILDEDDF